MFTRVVTYTGAKNLDAGIEYVREEALPNLHQQRGFQGITVSIDRPGKLLGILSLWSTAADREASDSGMEKARAEALRLVGGTLTVELFEQVVFDARSLPTTGAPLLVRRITMDPKKVDENTAYFRNEVLPQISSMPGYLSLRNMVNRTTGAGLVGSVWADEVAMKAAAKAADERRDQATKQGVTLGEQSKREIVLIDLV